MKTMLIDFENGRKTIGSDEKIKENFGFPPMKPVSWGGMQTILNQLFKEKVETTTIEIAPGITIEEEDKVVVQREGVGIECLVFDTFTEAVKKYMRELKGTKRKLDFAGWGDLKDSADLLLEYLNRFPTSIILNVHAKRVEDSDLGMNIYIPNIEGGTKEDIAKWFDFVLYTRVFKDEEGKYQYVWVTKKDERYNHAKDRSNMLPAEMPQDYGIIKDVVKEVGWDTFKCLVIGTPGSGKTMSLRTLI